MGTDTPACDTSKAYGTVLGEALFSGKIKEAFTEARARSPQGLQVLLAIEAPDLKHLHWERLCGPIRSGDRWDFLTRDQRFPFSLYLKSPSPRHLAIGRRDLKALVLVANPPAENPYRLERFDARATVASIRMALGDIRHEILANVPDGDGPPTLNTLLTQLAAQHYLLLHIVAQGWYRSQDKETLLYLLDDHEEIKPIRATDFLDRLDQLQGPRGLPHFIFLGTCESANPEAEYAGALGGLAQRLVRELGIPAVVAMTEKVSMVTAETLASSFYGHLREHGHPNRALVEACAGLEERYDITVPALYSRLGERPLFSDTEDRDLTEAEIEDGLSKLESLLITRAPVVQEQFQRSATTLRGMLGAQREDLSQKVRDKRDEELGEINTMCEEVLDLNFRALALGRKPPDYDERCPFRGLYPFWSEDREFFFGRETLVEQLQQKLIEHNFLAVLGPSGCGKSSLMFAGLMPALQERAPDLQMVSLTPGSDPLTQLEANLAKIQEQPAGLNGIDVKEYGSSPLVDRKKSSTPLVGGVRGGGTTPPETPPPPNLPFRQAQDRLHQGGGTLKSPVLPAVLVVDQFEELFTLCTNETKRQEFLNRLLRLPEHFPVVITMRADFWGECAPYQQLKEVMQAHQELIASMKTPELRRAMERQAEQVGLRFEADLSNTILDDVQPEGLRSSHHARGSAWPRGSN